MIIEEEETAWDNLQGHFEFDMVPKGVAANNLGTTIIHRHYDQDMDIGSEEGDRNLPQS